MNALAALGNAAALVDNAAIDAAAENLPAVADAGDGGGVVVVVETFHYNKALRSQWWQLLVWARPSRPVCWNVNPNIDCDCCCCCCCYCYQPRRD